MQLRRYQQEAVQAVYRYLREHDDSPVVVIPTGGGKTPVMATICRDAVKLWQGRVLVLAHVKELLEQTANKLREVCPEVLFGVYSAGLGRRETRQDVIVAGIQSVYKRARELGPFDLVLVDECHLIPPDGEGMYRQFLGEVRETSPHLRVVGLTATPFRLKSGLICSPDHFLNAICFEIGVRELIRDGYLSPLITKAGAAHADTSRVTVRAGEFVADEVEAVMDSKELVEAACQEIVERTGDRKACLIFASGISHGRHVCRVLHAQHGIECGFICGDTPDAERNELLARFRGCVTESLFARDPLKYLCNVNVLTTGFDAPHVDCIVLLRPTMSPGLFYQMAGRGFRTYPGKRNCLVLDFGGNVLRHGPVDQLQIGKGQSGDQSGIPPAKECPECHSLIATGYARCPDCGYEFPRPERKQHDAKPANAGILSGQITETEFEVRDITYTVHTKRGAPDDAPKTMRVDYRLGLSYWVSEFICFEHTGWARRNAERWWKVRSPDLVPETAEHAVDIANAGGVARVDSVTVRSVAGEKYDRIIGYKLGPLPEPVLAGDAVNQDDDIPF